MQLAGSKEGGWVYAKYDPGVQNGNSGQIVVNWLIAEHKSQGLFQMVAGTHELEQFGLFAISGKEGEERARRLQTELSEEWTYAGSGIACECPSLRRGLAASALAPRGAREGGKYRRGGSRT